MKKASFLSLFFIFILMSCSGFESIEGQYSTYAEAVHAIRSWLPQLTLESAYDIYEKHNLDTNESILWFQHKGGLNQKLINECQQLTITNVKWPRLKAAWWSTDLSKSTLQITQRHIFYYCENEKGYFAVYPNDSEAFFWRLSS